MKEYDLTILRPMFFLGRIGRDTIKVNQLLSFFPKSLHTKVNNTITDLIYHEFLERTPDDTISIKRDRREDISRLMNPEPESIIKSIKPIEESIPNSFDKRPFLVTQGSHKVKGVIDKYVFHKNKFDSSIVVYLVSDNQKKNTIKIGSLSEHNTLYRRALKGIDNVFGTSIFTKAMMNKLGSDIVGNRQPTKALIDIMIYDSYIIQTDKNHFMRTTKQIPPSNGLLVEK